MEFFIRKKATLPILEVDVIKDGRLDYNNKLNLSSSTITFSMKDVDTGFYKVTNGTCFYSVENESVYYQFTQRNTSNIGRFEGEFNILTNQGNIILPLRDRLFINVIDSFVDPDFCCIPNGSTHTLPPTPTPTVTPTPTPTPTPVDANKIYYGKFTGETITSGDVNNLNIRYTNAAIDTYVDFNYGGGYGYILIPSTFIQPSKFVNSEDGCDGIIIPTNNIGTVVVNNINGTPVTYNVYRTFNYFFGVSYSYMCS